MKNPVAFVLVALLTTSLSSTPSKASLSPEWWKASGAFGVGIATLGVSTLALKVPSACSWCEPPAFDLSVSNALISNSRRDIGVASDVLVYGAMPALTLGFAVYASMGSGYERLALNVLTLLDTLLLNYAVTEIFKRTMARARPEVYFGYPNVDQSDAFLSFPSGHTSAAFALAGAASTLAFCEGYSWAPYLAVGSGLAALGAGYMRIAAGKHWATDVLTGMAIGTVVGVGVPLFVRGCQDKKPDQLSWQLTPIPGQSGLQLSMIW
jgi:membrane-associated phospholipid phosphatase